MEFEHWDELVYGIARGKCILFLGPQLPVLSDTGQRLVPIQELAAQLLEKLDEEDKDRQVSGINELAQISQRFLVKKGELNLEMEINRWHEDIKQHQSPLHAKLASLPFHHIITSSHDAIMETALRSANKQPNVERYHFKGKNKELLPEASDDTPILFHLYGHISEPSSVVITDTQLLDFLAALISKDPPLPNDLNATLTQGSLFLFLGFGIHQWYLRILLHVLKVLRQGSRTFAIEFGNEELDTSAEDAVLFYRQNYMVDIYKGDIFEFVSELHQHCTPHLATNVSTEKPSVETPHMEAPNQPKVFICHASEDKKYASAITEGLTKAGFSPWLDEKSLRGGQEWDKLIESTIKSIDYFVVLNSQNLLAKSKGSAYVNKEINVALRTKDWHFGSFIIPVKVDGSPLLDQLNAFHFIDYTKEQDGLRDLVRAIKREAGHV